MSKSIKAIIKYFYLNRLIRLLKNYKTLLYSFGLQSRFRYCDSSTHFGKIGSLHGFNYIYIGRYCYFQDFIFLTAWKVDNGQPSITIGNNCHFGAFNHISCINKIIIGDNCLTGKWVTIVDNNHGETNEQDMSISPLKRKLVSKGPICIGKNVWISDKVSILSGVTIGDGAVIAANSVVTKDVPPYCVAAGNPARIIKNVK